MTGDWNRTRCETPIQREGCASASFSSSCTVIVLFSVDSVMRDDEFR